VVSRWPASQDTESPEAGRDKIFRFHLPRGPVLRYHRGMAESRPEHSKTDTPPEVLRVQYKIYRQMSGAHKFRLVFDMYEMGRRLAMAGLRMRHPNAMKEEIRQLWVQQHLGRELSEKVYGMSSNERKV